jgi:hypothetical protein
MSFEKGHIKKGGRAKGTPNKTNEEIRQNIHLLIENNLPKIQEWIDQVAKESPNKAIEIVLKLTDYTLPKLKSIEYKSNTNDPFPPPFEWFKT